MRYRMNRCASPLRRRLRTPASGRLAPTPPIDPSPVQDHTSHQPNCWIHNGKLSYDRRAEPTATASQPHPAAYNPQGS